MPPSLIVPEQAVQGSASPDPEPVHVFVTGFGKFRDTPGVNPSWEMVKRLPTTLAPTPQCPHPIRIWTLSEGQAVGYDAVDALYRRLRHDRVQYGAVLHCGVASNRPYFSIEKLAHRSGYTSLDVDGRLPDADSQPEYCKSGPAELAASLEFDQVRRFWEGEAAAQPHESTNAGRYLCEYILYHALATFDAPGALLAAHQTVTTFLHVPAGTDEASLARGRGVVEALLRAMVCVHLERRKES